MDILCKRDLGSIWLDKVILYSRCMLLAVGFILLFFSTTAQADRIINLMEGGEFTLVNYCAGCKSNTFVLGHTSGMLHVNNEFDFFGDSARWVAWLESPGIFRIANKYGGGLLNIDGNNGSVNLTHDREASGTYWIITRSGNANVQIQNNCDGCRYKGYYLNINVKSGLVELTASASGTHHWRMSIIDRKRAQLEADNRKKAEKERVDKFYKKKFDERRALVKIAQEKKLAEEKRIAALNNIPKQQRLPVQPILRTVQNPYTIVAPTKQVPRRGLDYTWSIESAAYPNNYIKVPNDINIDDVFLNEIRSGLDAVNARFSAGDFDTNDGNNLINFELPPDYFLRYFIGGNLKILPYEHTVDFVTKASFIPRNALDGSNGFTFESYPYPGYYLKVASDYQLIFAQDDGSTQFAKEASFFMVPSITFEEQEIDQSQGEYPSYDLSGQVSEQAPAVNTNNDLDQRSALQDQYVALIGFRVNHGQLIDAITPIYSQIQENLQLNGQFEGNRIGGTGGKETILKKDGYVVTGFDIQRGSYFGKTEVIHIQVIWSRWGVNGIVPNSSVSSEKLGSGKHAKITTPLQTYRAIGNSFISEIDATMSHRTSGETFLNDMKISKTQSLSNN